MLLAFLPTATSASTDVVTTAHASFAAVDAVAVVSDAVAAAADEDDDEDA
jgi:hypothetical protein